METTNTRAPVALFAFRRPSHTQMALQALASNNEASETDLYAFVDGARTEAEEKAVDSVVDIIKHQQGFRSVTLIRSSSNRGLAESITSGIGAVLRKHERIIVVEDDVVVSEHFLSYMNDHLDLYSRDENVASVHAYVYPHSNNSLPETFFIRGADCWGWGTWSRSWKHFQPAGDLLLRELRERRLCGAFDFDGTAPFTEMLEDQVAGRNDSWAIRWHASTFLKGMYTLYPRQAMAVNIGEDGSGRHRGSSTHYVQDLSLEPLPIVRQVIEESENGREAFKAFFRTRYHLPRSATARWLRRYVRRARLTLRRAAASSRLST